MVTQKIKLSLLPAILFFTFYCNAQNCGRDKTPIAKIIYDSLPSILS